MTFIVGESGITVESEDSALCAPSVPEETAGHDMQLVKTLVTSSNKLVDPPANGEVELKQRGAVTVTRKELEQ
jgi:hypothetical protein